MAWTNLHRTLHQCVRQRFPQLRGEKLLLAVSGGQDSLCLLHLLNDLTQQWHWNLAVAHCDHGWPTDVGIADHVRAIAQDYNLPYFQANAQDLAQTEAAARHWRYQALTAIAEGENFGVVVTGHTQSDRAETLLFNLMRGSGSDGLRALGWRRPLTEKIMLVRPMLIISRKETGDFCRSQGLPVWEDVLNEKLTYRRNRIRQELIPYLQEHFNPQVEKALAQTVEILAAEVDYLEQKSWQIYQQLRQTDPLGLDRPLLKEQPLALQRRIVAHFLGEYQRRSPNFEQIEAVLVLIAAPQGSQTSTLPGNWVIRVEGDFLRPRTVPPRGN